MIRKVVEVGYSCFGKPELLELDEVWNGEGPAGSLGFCRERRRSGPTMRNAGPERRRISASHVARAVTTEDQGLWPAEPRAETRIQQRVPGTRLSDRGREASDGAGWRSSGADPMPDRPGFEPRHGDLPGDRGRKRAGERGNELTAGRGVLSSGSSMKSLSGLLSVAAVLSFTGCATTPPVPTPEARFKSADANGDGVVTRAEYDSHQIGEMFARFDTNKDSVITEKEFLDNGGTAEGFRKINTSGSGKITLEEAQASAAVRKSLDAPFQEADLNRDGKVSLAEFLAARKSALDYVR